MLAPGWGDVSVTGTFVERSASPAKLPRDGRAGGRFLGRSRRRLKGSLSRSKPGRADVAAGAARVDHRTGSDRSGVLGGDRAVRLVPPRCESESVSHSQLSDLALAPACLL